MSEKPILSHKEGNQPDGKPWASVTSDANLSEFFAEMYSGTDRVTAIVTVAYIEQQVKEILDLFLVNFEAGDEKEIIDVRGRIFSPSNNGALSTFAAMVDIAFFLGLLPRLTYKQARVMAKIRNDFAHNHFIRNFDDLSLKDRKSAKSIKELRQLSRVTRSYPEVQTRGVYHAVFTEVFGVLQAARLRCLNLRCQEVMEHEIVSTNLPRYDGKPKSSP